MAKKLQEASPRGRRGGSCLGVVETRGDLCPELLPGAGRAVGIGEEDVPRMQPIPGVRKLEHLRPRRREASSAAGTGDEA